MIASNTRKCAFTSSATWWVSEFRPSNIVSTIPSTPSSGLKAPFTRSIVAIRCVSPSSAKYSHWSGTSTRCAAVSAFSVKSPSEGGQSSTT
jgi:hypothetical protein